MIRFSILALALLAAPAFATKKPDPVPAAPEPAPSATSNAQAGAAALGVGVGIGVGQGGSAAATGGNAAAIGGGADVTNVVAPVATGGNAAQHQGQDQQQLQGQQQGQYQQATSDQTQGQQQQANATNAGNTQATEVNITGPDSMHYSGKYTVRSAPGIVAPNAYPTAPCIVGYSGGVSLIGGALTLGGGKEDKGCTIRETARTLAMLGEQCAAVRYLMAQNADIANVYGAELPAACLPPTTPEPVAVAPVAPPQPPVTVICERPVPAATPIRPARKRPATVQKTAPACPAVAN